jgi:hypothetical protein
MHRRRSARSRHAVPPRRGPDADRSTPCPLPGSRRESRCRSGAHSARRPTAVVHPRDCPWSRASHLSPVGAKRALRDHGRHECASRRAQSVEQPTAPQEGSSSGAERSNEPSTPAPTEHRPPRASPGDDELGEIQHQATGGGTPGVSRADSATEPPGPAAGENLNGTARVAPRFWTSISPGDAHQIREAATVRLGSLWKVGAER